MTGFVGLFGNVDCANQLLTFLHLPDIARLSNTSRRIHTFINNTWTPFRIHLDEVFRTPAQYTGPNHDRVLTAERARLERDPETPDCHPDLGDHTLYWKCRRNKDKATRDKLDRIHIAGPCASLIYMAHTHYIFTSFRRSKISRLLKQASGRLQHLTHPMGVTEVRATDLQTHWQRRVPLALAGTDADWRTSGDEEAHTSHDYSTFDLFKLIIENQSTLETIDIRSKTGLPLVNLGGLSLCPRVFFEGPEVTSPNQSSGAWGDLTDVKCVHPTDSARPFHLECWRKVLQGFGGCERKSFPKLKTLILNGRTSVFLMLLAYFGFYEFPALETLQLQGSLSSIAEDTATVHLGLPGAESYWYAVCGKPPADDTADFRLIRDLCAMFLLSANVLEASLPDRNPIWFGLLKTWFSEGAFPRLKNVTLCDEGSTTLRRTRAFTSLPRGCIAGWLQSLPSLECLALNRGEQVDSADCVALLKWARLLPNQQSEESIGYPKLTTVILSKPRVLEALLPLQKAVTLHLGRFISLRIRECYINLTSGCFLRQLAWLSSWEREQKEVFSRLLRWEPSVSLHKPHSFGLFASIPTLTLDFRDVEHLSVSIGPSDIRSLWKSQRCPDRFAWNIEVPDICRVNLLNFNPLRHEHVEVVRALQFVRSVGVSKPYQPGYALSQRKSNEAFFQRENVSQLYSTPATYLCIHSSQMKKSE
eukprot:Blabericola_migrator_1__2084@NODE_1574_length_4259_cov_30_803912_g1029_i0_p1_GENE_NODE_1574_length_4259_cov_30_803912_g1029_i0NODE_1574_length_4259_cov_30_803912_g1029_i0_p1_ORF_typecomplete_len703_score55_11_NODE_1574_length_4259_cov_30_803912_g1029_i01242232